MNGFEMFCDAEFRGLKVQTTKKGNSYYLLNFEAPQNGTSNAFYFPIDGKSQIAPQNLEKGKIYTLFLDYHFNRFDNAMRLELVDFVPLKKPA